MKLIENTLNRHFTDRLGDNHKIQFDLSNVEALQDDEVKKAELADRLIKSGVMTPNEVRQRVYKLTSHGDGDLLIGSIGRGLQAEPPPSIPEGERPSDGEPIRSLSYSKELVDSITKQREDQEQRPQEEMSNLAVSLFQKYLEVLVH
jgi:hypothetical protein